MVADTAARIAKRCSLDWHKLPIVFSRSQRQLQHAIGFRIAYFAIPNWRANFVVLPSSRPHDDLANPACGVGIPLRVLRRKAFVKVFVPCQNQISALRIEVLPERLELGVQRVLLFHAAAVEWVMAISENASVGALGKVAFEPAFLR